MGINGLRRWNKQTLTTDIVPFYEVSDEDLLIEYGAECEDKSRGLLSDPSYADDYATEILRRMKRAT